MARVGLNILSTNPCNVSSFDAFGRNIGRGIVEFSISPGSTESFVAKYERRGGNDPDELVDEDPCPGQNCHLTRVFEG